MSDDIIKFDTSESLKTEVKPVENNYFQLVSEDHPILREQLPVFDFANPPVNPNQFASTMVETCKLHKGIGLSANQCGFKYRMFVMGAEDNYVAFFNPRITHYSTKTQHGVEGCLSFPFLGLSITRYDSIKVEYQDFTGALKTAEYSGLSARCFQHELDHMNGIVYTQKVKPLALQMGMKKRKKLLQRIGLK